MLDGLDGAVEAMSEPMVSHDCIAFYLLSKAVSEHVTVVQSGQGADELLAGYDWYPPLADVSPERALEVYSAHFFDRNHQTLGQILQPQWMTPDDPSRDFVRAHLDRPGATEALDKVLRLDSQIMLVDDPVKRVDNMTMAWGLEARTPFLDHEFAELAAACPPELKLAHNGKGVLKEASRKVLPAAVIDRKKGSFPVPAIINLEGLYLERVRDALSAPAAKNRDLFRPEYVRAAAGRPEQEPDHPGLEPAVAAGPARDVVAASWDRLRRAGVRTVVTPGIARSPRGADARHCSDAISEIAGVVGAWCPSLSPGRPPHRLRHGPVRAAAAGGRAPERGRRHRRPDPASGVARRIRRSFRSPGRRTDNGWRTWFPRAG